MTSEIIKGSLMPKSIVLSDEEVRRLKALIGAAKIQILEPKDYEVIRANSNGVFLILYTSNKLVYEDTKEAQDILEQVLEKKNLGKSYIGSDETGKGEWYGPLVVVGTCLDADQINELRKIGVRDSKTLSIEKIHELAREMISKKIIFRYRELGPERYNELINQFNKEGKNSNDLLAWAHSEVVKDLIEKTGTDSVEVIIDKFDFTKTDSRLSGDQRARKVDQSKIHVTQKSKGESEIPVAAASILAKHIFEEDVEKLSKKFKLQLKTISPSEVPREILPKVAKTNFRNIKELL